MKIICPRLSTSFQYSLLQWSSCRETLTYIYQSCFHLRMWYAWGKAVVLFVEALRYNPDGRGFDSR